MARLLTFPAGRRAKWAVLAAWALLVAAVVAFDLPAKFERAQENEPVSFLPGDTESVRVLERLQRRTDGQREPAVIVARRADGLTEADRRRIAELRESLRSDPPAAVTSVSGPRVADDGTTALLVADVRRDGENEVLTAAIDGIRERVDRLDRVDGLRAAVTGPAAFAKDAIDVFATINSTLLVVTASLVFLLLVLIYRSPIFWAVPLMAVGAAEVGSRGAGWGLTELGLTVNGQSAGILLVLVFGAGTDYALLLVARYREELRRHEDRHEAMAVALRRAGPAIVASGLTVIAALLVLLVARVNGTQGLGPTGAVGIALAMASGLTLLPALLVVVRRGAFWPFVPRVGEEGADETHGPWRRVAERVGARPRRVWAAGVAALAVLAGGLGWLDVGLTQDDYFRGEVESVRGQRLAAEAFGGGALAPAVVVVPPQGDYERVRRVTASTDGVASLGRDRLRGEPGAIFDAVLAADPYSRRAFDVVEDLRERLDGAGVGRALVGGPTAEERDYRAAALRDDLVVPPLVLVVVFLILAAVLRALLLPALVVATVVLSYAAALGVGAFVSEVVLGYPGIEPSLPLIAFIFGVALGTDYNIFLLTRVREEAARHGTREGTLRGLAVTGGVITAAGIVLAGTFSTLAVLPLVALTQIGIIVAFGVLLDTFLVRSVIVPALSLDLGPRVWWPSTLSAALERRFRRLPTGRDGRPVTGPGGTAPAPNASPAPGTPPTPPA